jgi:hypothetical protein
MHPAHLTRFVERHPGCVVGRPDWLTPLMWLAVTLAASAACIFLCVRTAQTSVAIAGALFATLAAALGVRRVPLLRETLTRALAGRACFAVADDEVLLIDRSGRAVLVAIDRITELTLAGSEPRLKTDSEAQGIVYATLFSLFDADDVGPNPQRFFEALAPRVRALCPRAHVAVRDGCDDPLLVD